MGAVATLLTTVVATAGAVALYRYIDGKRNRLRHLFTEPRRAEKAADISVIDYERDPATGVFKPKSI